MFTDLLTFHHFGGFRPGLAVVVQQHGGHFWSTQDEARPADMVSLRIDAREKLGMELTDAVVAPTRYMCVGWCVRGRASTHCTRVRAETPSPSVTAVRSFDWYAQRGWHVPNTTAILPNVMGAMGASAPAHPQTKKVWRLAFFGRLEERKGLVRGAWHAVRACVCVGGGRGGGSAARARWALAFMGASS